ncbi:MAG TPA: GvpL/GvpF family gas vesicle protein [Candidatus Acidoferrum sp.]|nr:GvpL/GvpF family gas vesicle protein [Candidatus Acidoferrum sp.]
MAREILAEPAQELTIRLVSLGPGAARATLRAIAERLVERAEVSEWRYRGDEPGGPVASLAFLVPRVGDFLARVAPVAARAGDVAVVPTGPWAPSSFTPRLPVPATATASKPLARAG